MSSYTLATRIEQARACGHDLERIVGDLHYTPKTVLAVFAAMDKAIAVTDNLCHSLRHEMTPDNTIRHARRTECRACKQGREQRRRDRRRAA